MPPGPHSGGSGDDQHVVEGLAERLRLLETARGLTASPSAHTNGRWREQDPVVGALRVRMTDTKVRAKAVETQAAVHYAKLCGLEADLFKRLASLSEHCDATAAALGHTLGEQSTALLTVMEDAVALRAAVDTLASGSGPAAAPTADPVVV